VPRQPLSARPARRRSRGGPDHDVVRVHEHDHRVQVPARRAAQRADVNAIGATGDPRRREIMVDREAAVADLAVSQHRLHVHSTREDALRSWISRARDHAVVIYAVETPISAVRSCTSDGPTVPRPGS